MRRNGVARSERATWPSTGSATANWLTVMTIVTDPVYLTEPFVRTTDYELDLTPADPALSLRSGGGDEARQGSGTDTFCRAKILS